jgi:hypothetical protein
MSDEKTKAKIEIPREPPAGSYAATARFMAELFPEEDWDAWKDEMKESMHDDE